MPGPESTIEKYLQKTALDNGALFYKFESPSTDGVPDRILVYRGLIVFIELKAPGESPRPLQVSVMKDLRAAGANVAVVASKADCDKLISILAGTDASTLPRPNLSGFTPERTPAEKRRRRPPKPVPAPPAVDGGSILSGPVPARPRNRKD